MNSRCAITKIINCSLFMSGYTVGDGGYRGCSLLKDDGHEIVDNCIAMQVS